MKLIHLLNLKTSGTILSASDHTINSIIEYITADRDIVILEIGHGDGCITDAILGKMSQDSRLIGLELNPKFHKELKSKLNDRRVTLVNDNVLNLKSIVAKLSIQKFDLIISTLPLSYFDKSEQENIFDQIKSLMDGQSTFIQAVHIPNVLALLKEYFGDIKSKIVLLNLPPYLLYICKL